MPQITTSQLDALFRRHDLGPVRQVEPATSGIRNESYLVNGEYFARFNTRDPGMSKFHSEALAYHLLAERGLPVPRVLALDETRQVVPFDVIILSRLPGKNAAESRLELNPSQVRELAYAAGRCLAEIHQVTYSGFGKLRDLEKRPFPSWAAYFSDYASRYLAPAREHGWVDEISLRKLEAALAQAQPLLARVSRSVLLHSDYHYENILQQDGRLTGIVDFEWAMAGDPSTDFVAADVRERMLPGSEPIFMQGYHSLGALDSEHPQRLWLYHLFLALETVVTARRWGDEPGSTAAAHALVKLLA